MSRFLLCGCCFVLLLVSCSPPLTQTGKRLRELNNLKKEADKISNSLAHIKEIMGESMESLIHHFKLVTEGFEVPVGQVYQAVESPRGELGVYLEGDGGPKPYRVHFRTPSFDNLQVLPVMAKGTLVADLVAIIGSVDIVLGDIDR